MIRLQRLDKGSRHGTVVNKSCSAAAAAFAAADGSAFIDDFEVDETGTARLAVESMSMLALHFL